MSVREGCGGYDIEQQSPDFVIEGDGDTTRITFEGRTETVSIQFTNDEAAGLIEELAERLTGRV